jgi:hypothetical protein
MVLLNSRSIVSSMLKCSSKAFDKVRHRLLLEKMSADVEPDHCQWLDLSFCGKIQRMGLGDKAVNLRPLVCE